MHDGGADLALDVVADDRKPLLGEALFPLWVRRDEHRHAVHESTPGFEGAFGVELGGPLRPHGQIGNENVDAPVSQDGGDVGGLGIRLFDDIAQVATDPVEGRSSFDRDTEMRHCGKTLRVVRRSQNSLSEVEAHFVGVDVEGRHGFDVANMVAVHFDVHQTRNRLVRACVSIVFEALNQGRGTIAYPDEANAKLLLSQCPFL